jgi:hypothetical protein
MNIFTQFFKKNIDNHDIKQSNISRDLLRREAKIGGSLFGPIKKGSDRQFFQLEKNTWIWVEKWTESGRQRTKTTKYLVKPTELIKSVNGGHYERTSLQEAKNFEQAVHLYVQEVDAKIYGNVIKSSN